MGYHYPSKQIHPDQKTEDGIEKDVLDIENFIAAYVPKAFRKILRTKTCLYTNSPDENFIIDYLPNSKKKIIIATGFSGHGFKFVPAVGAILAGLCMEEKLKVNIDFLSWR